MSTKYVVCYGWKNDPAQVHYLVIPDDCSYVSGQPNIEEFDNEADAKTRAEELGYVFHEDI